MFADVGTTRQFNVSDFLDCRFHTSLAPVGVRFRPLPMVYPFSYNAATYIEVDNVDVTSTAIEWESLDVQNILTRQIDTCAFSYKLKAGSAWIGKVGSNVKVYDTGSLIFQGVIMDMQAEQISSQLLRVKVNAVDYTHELDGKLIGDQFTAQTMEYIINYLVTKYAPQFTTNSVHAAQTVNFISFAYQTFSACLQALADMAGYDWYVDQYKDIHFFDATQYSVAPFSVTDTNGSYDTGSLVLKDDISQLRNSVYLRGGNSTDASVTTSLTAAAGTIQTVFQCGYHFSAVPAVTNGGAAQTVGTLNVDNPANFQCMWDSTNNIIQFASAVTAGNIVAITGTPLNPIRLYLPNRPSIAKYGERQILIIDSTITTRNGAMQRAKAELLKYAASIVSGTFTTKTKGLYAGQYLTLNSTQFNKSGTYIITQVETQLYTPNAYQYQVTIVSTKLLEFIDLFVKLLRSQIKTVVYAANESFDPAEAALETATFIELVSATTSHNAVPESTAAVDSAALAGGTGLNFGTKFVFGPFAPSGVSRQFNFDRSPLG